MAGTVYEWYGYGVTDLSVDAEVAAAEKTCVFVPGPCTKKGGACAVKPANEPVVVCPKRLYFDQHRFLRDIASDAFSEFNIRSDENGQALLVHGDRAREEAMGSGQNQVGVFGQEFSGEIKLPPAMPGGARYAVDFTLVVVDPSGDLLAFTPVEVQTIDTTGSYQSSLKALCDDRTVVPSTFGMNWENVNKRILPQLIIKGLMLQGERLCGTGMYFVTPEPVFDRIMLRLGSVDRLRRIPKQPGSITFVRYRYAYEETALSGTPLTLVSLDDITISTSDMSLAFISPENLPAIGSFEASIRARM
ncbi:NotI family restriction endonuclease [Mycolicibacterium porcinum]|uniref:NotI family restriction endonuclease n=1 Tax=Mycolicibacterium porcinum TaxID=39693 RepID=UPI000848D5B0|nr:NotI family restriction endonuclease [Mycolicibacterium porcinum]ODR25445.1 hypothetical protein BHQ19_12145 [Mycolicibacterium porcinum]